LLFSSLLFAFVLFVNFFGFLMWEHTSLFILSKKKTKKGFVWKVEEWEIILVGVYHGFAMGHPKIASAWSW
jgi:hypothetical protein